MSTRAGTQPYRLFKRKIDKKGKRRLYYARIINPETGKLARTVSTKETSYVRAVHWVDLYLQRKLERREQEIENANSLTIQELSSGFWEIDAQYARSRRARGYTISHGHLDISESYTRNHIIPAWGSRRISGLTTGEIDCWIVELHRKGKIAGATINKVLQCLRTLLDGAVKGGYITDNPATAVKPVRVKHKKRGVLTDAEVAELLRTPDHWRDFRHYVINLLAFTTGMRIGEIRGLRVEDVHPDHVTIVQGWEEGYGPKEPKYGSVRAVPISERLYKALQRVIAENDAESLVFYSKFDKSAPVSKSHIEHSLYNALVNMSLDDNERSDPKKRAKALQYFIDRRIVFHSWRHKLNSVLRSRGVPDSKIRLLTGHRGGTMTDWYTRFEQEDYAEILSVQSLILHSRINERSEVRAPVQDSKTLIF